jgi:hypothetical protein
VSATDEAGKNGATGFEISFVRAKSSKRLIILLYWMSEQCVDLSDGTQEAEDWCEVGEILID